MFDEPNEDSEQPTIPSVLDADKKNDLHSLGGSRDTKQSDWPFNPVKKDLDTVPSNGKGASNHGLPPLPSGVDTLLMNGGHSHKKYFIIGLLGILLIIAGVMVYLRYYSHGDFEENKVKVLDPNNEEKEVAGNEQAVIDEEVVVVEDKIDEDIDTDHDGVLDKVEQEKGTNIYSADTDDDGLTDYEELQVYGTNPLSGDTDGDGYFDGVEVRNGFNPAGPGSL